MRWCEREWTNMQTAAQLAVSSQLHKNLLVERQTDEV